MTMATQHEVLRAHLKEWLAARGDKKKRGEIIDVMCGALGMHPKSVPRAFYRQQMKDSAIVERRGRPRVFGPDVTAALKDVWEAAHYPCGEILSPMIVEYVAILSRDNQWNHSKEATEKLLIMKEHTVRRRLTALRRKYRLSSCGLSSTKPSHLKSIIPIFKGPWNTLPPGTGQLDTVAHCGESLAGDFIYTVNYTDAATYWIIPHAQWNKGQMATVQSLATIREHLPFTLSGLHPDTGSEFINYHLKGWCDEKKIELTRSEPYKKNDNMFVEERNGHVVRKYVGYLRLDVPETVSVLNELYEHLALYLNHFIPVRRTISKERIGAKYHRVYEKRALTPYQRVLAHATISEEVKRRLQKEHAELNPLTLKTKIDTIFKRILNRYQSNHGAGASI